jgi:hypothetical protein
MSNNLSGISSLGYQGTNAANPPNVSTHKSDPNPNITQNFSIGDIWINTTLLKIWMLVSLAGNQATWQLLRGGSIDSLTSNAGGVVDPDGDGNINVVGDGTTITGVGNPGTNTITFSTLGTGVLSSLTGNSGGAVSPLAGNINVVGSGAISVVGNPGTHTLTVTPSGSIPSSFPANTGTAIPTTGILNVLGSLGIATTGSGNTLTVSNNGTLSNSFVTDSGTAVPAAGALNVVGSNGLTTIGTGSTVTVSTGGTIPTSFATDSGIAIPATGILNIVGSGGLTTIGTGSTVTVTAIFSALSFTPILSFGGSTTGITYDVREGHYQALGNLVFYSASIAINNKGSATGQARLSGLPFASSGTFNTQMGVMAESNITFNAGQTYAWCLNDIGTTSLLFSTGGSGVVQNIMTDANFSNTSQLTVSGFYFRA